MQTSGKDGIVCDKCGTSYKIDFDYFSFDFRNISVIQNRKPSLQQIFMMPIVFSLDICPLCFDTIKKKVSDNYSKIMVDNVKYRGRQTGTVCEFTGNKMIGTYDFYYINVIKINIKMSDQPSICVKCKNKAYKTDEPCSKCGGTDFVCVAKSSIDDRFVEISISEQAFRDMVHNAEIVRKVAGEWSTKT